MSRLYLSFVDAKSLRELAAATGSTLVPSDLRTFVKTNSTTVAVSVEASRSTKIWEMALSGRVNTLTTSDRSKSLKIGDIITISEGGDINSCRGNGKSDSNFDIDNWSSVISSVDRSGSGGCLGNISSRSIRCRIRTSCSDYLPSSENHSPTSHKVNPHP